MRGPWKKILTVGVAVCLAAVWADAAAAKKKPKPQHPEDSLITHDYDGTPIIMQGYHPRRPTPEELAPERRTDRPVHIPRGSSTYIPPPVPSPYSRNSPPAAALTQPMVQPYNPPPITTFSDRVTNAIHAYPLEKGIGNNPTDQQQFIRQRANQP